jgi:hypothetical protein
MKALDRFPKGSAGDVAFSFFSSHTTYTQIPGTGFNTPIRADRAAGTHGTQAFDTDGDNGKLLRFPLDGLTPT